MDRDVDVTGELALNSGDIAAGANTLTLALPATTSGIGDVWGNMRRIGPLVTGTCYGFGNPNVSLNFASGTLPSEITVNLVPGTPAGFANAVSRSYTITPSGGSDYSATVRLRYLAGGVGRQRRKPIAPLALRRRNLAGPGPGRHRHDSQVGRGDRRDCVLAVGSVGVRSPTAVTPPHL